MDINTTTIFITVALAHFVALLSPGPDFLLVVKSAVRNKKQVAIGVALGIASANAVYIALCLAGVGAILASSITIMAAIKFAGGVFLTYLAVMALKAKKSDYAFLIKSAEAEDTKESTLPKEFLIGFASGILNPKNPLFYLSLFTLILNIALGVWMTLIVFLWDSFIIFALSHKHVRSLFNRGAFYIDKTAGVILGAFGLTLIYSALIKNNK